MKWFNVNKMILIGFVAVVVLCVGSAKADIIFGRPTNLGPNINSDGTDGLTISKDGLEIFFFSDRPNSPTWDLFTSVRKTTSDEWEPAINLGSPLNSPRSEGYPSLSADGLELYYTAPYWQAGWTEYGKADLWVSRRSSVSEAWGSPQNLGGIINTAFHDTEPSISQDGLELYFSSTRPGGYGEWNIWVTTRMTKDDPWQEPTNLGPTVNSGTEGTPNISCDGLVLFFCSGRPGGYGEGDIWLTRRKSKTEPWGEPINLGPPVNDLNGQWAPCLSHDGSTLYFTDHKKRPRYGYFDVWQMDASPSIDFNGDDYIDMEDLLILVEHWGLDEPMYDIGPTPWGDGIIDVQDLTILGEHLFKEVISIGSFTEDPIGVYTMTDRSVDVYGSADQFHFGYKTLTGPGTIVARIESMTNTHLWAKAGVMIRETRDAGSKHAFVFVTPGKGVHFQGRSDTSGETVGYAQQTGVTAPHWVRLEWDGQGNFTAAHSPDGSTWQSVVGGASMSISMNSDVHMGLALCSHNMAEMCEAVFTDVAINGSVGSEWASTDINIVFRLP